MLDQARSSGPQALRVFGRKVLDVVAPAVAASAERRALEREEALARDRVRLTTHRLGDGTTMLRARLSDASAARLTSYLLAYTSPAHLGATHPRVDGPIPVPDAVGLGRAFEAFLEHVDPKRMPLQGGNATSVVVMIDEASLRDDVGSATTTSGQAMSLGAVRRLACTAGILPMVLSGRSEVLDIGRRRRYFTHAQRVALAVHDRGCRASGCTFPAAMCEAHHLDPWVTGGKTDLARGMLLCPFHHRLMHDPSYRHVISTERRVQFTKINRRT